MDVSSLPWDKRISGVYKMTFAPERFYVGSSIHIKRRVATHSSQMENGSHRNIRLIRAFAKYGPPHVEVIIVCRPDDCLLYEQIAIDALKPLYNFSRIAGKVEFTAEVRAKHSIGIRAAFAAMPEKIKANADRLHSDPVIVAKHREAVRLLPQNPSWQAALAAGIAKRDADPNYQIKTREGARKRSASPEWKKNHRDGIIAVTSTETWKANHRRGQQGKWTIDFKKRHSASVRAARHEKRLVSPAGPFIDIILSILSEPISNKTAAERLNSAKIPHTTGKVWTVERVIDARKWRLP